MLGRTLQGKQEDMALEGLLTIKATLRQDMAGEARGQGTSNRLGKKVSLGG